MEKFYIIGNSQEETERGISINFQNIVEEIIDKNRIERVDLAGKGVKLTEKRVKFYSGINLGKESDYFDCFFVNELLLNELFKNNYKFNCIGEVQEEELPDGLLKRIDSKYYEPIA